MLSLVEGCAGCSGVRCRPGRLGEVRKRVSGPTVYIELILVSVDPDGLTFRTAGCALPDGAEPDQVASDLGPTSESDALLHSTSWRYEPGRVILTYVVVPDPDPGAKRRPVADDLAQSEDASEGPDVALAQVAAHACRHLAFLLATDEEVARAMAGQKDVRRLLRRYVPDVAGRLDADEP
jgi:hypothetical protein